MALSWLPEEERASITKFKFERDQHLALGSLLLRRHYFSEHLGVNWLDLEFDRLPGGKPILKGHNNIDFNVSHEGNWVIFGVAKKMMMKIGIDTVTIDRPKKGSIDSFVKSFQSQLTPNEMQLIADSGNDDNQLQTFYELWGCKESYIKAIGTGLSLELNKLDFMNENKQIKMNFEGKRLKSWCYHLSYLDDISLAVICCAYESNHHQLDSKMIDFSKTTRLLGKPLHDPTREMINVFHQVKLEDIQNNKWLSR